MILIMTDVSFVLLGAGSSLFAFDHFHLPAASGGQSYVWCWTYGVIYSQLTYSKHILLYPTTYLPDGGWNSSITEEEREPQRG